MKLEDTISFAYGRSLTEGDTTVADREIEKMVETDDHEVDDPESEEGANVPGMGSYFICSERPQ